MEFNRLPDMNSLFIFAGIGLISCVVTVLYLVIRLVIWIMQHVSIN